MFFQYFGQFLRRQATSFGLLYTCAFSIYISSHLSTLFLHIRQNTPTFQIDLFLVSALVDVRRYDKDPSSGNSRGDHGYPLTDLYLVIIWIVKGIPRQVNGQNEQSTWMAKNVMIFASKTRGQRQSEQLVRATELNISGEECVQFILTIATRAIIVSSSQALVQV